MHIERLYIGLPDHCQVEHQRVELSAGAGIVGDRYFGRADEPGQNITLIEAEVLEAFALAHHRAIDFSISRRNVITRGLRLNELVGREFQLGGLRLRGVELCEPCAGLGQSLASVELPAPAIVRYFLRRGGLRADVLSSGTLSVGDGFLPSPAPTAG